MSQKPSERVETINPVNITKDIWFYPTEKKLEFTVWVKGQVILFDVSKKKLSKYLSTKGN